MRRFTLSGMLHMAAGLLFIVSSATAFFGATVLRPDQKPVALVTAAGCVLALAAIEKRLLTNLVMPTANSLRLLICMLPFLAMCTFFSSAAFFHAHRTDLATQAEREAAWARWQTERARLIDFQSAATALLRTAEAQEQAALAVGAPADMSRADAANLRRQRRARLATLAAAQKLPAQLPPLPLTPEDEKTADAALAAGYGWAQRVALGVPADIGQQLHPPVPEQRKPLAEDEISILLRESAARTPTALLAWSAALAVECLPFLCLWAATPGVPFATRIHRSRMRVATIRPALTDPLGRLDVPFRVANNDMTGVVTLHGNIIYLHVSDFAMALRAMYPAFAEKAGRQITDVQVVDAEGNALRHDLPLARALADGPLILEIA